MSFVNPWYTHVSGIPAALTRGVSALFRTEFDSIAAAFDSVYQQVFSSALPGISAGTAGMLVTNNGSAGSWAAFQNMPWTNVSTTSQSAVAGVAYQLTNVAATTVTLPATPAANDKILVKATNGLTSNIINPNGNTIEGVAGNMTIDVPGFPVRLQYVNSSWRLV